MKHTLFLLLVLAAFGSKAQTYNPDKINKKAIDAFERGLVNLRDGYIKEAVPLLKRAIEIEPNYVDAILSLGGTYGELKDYQAAIAQYEKGGHWILPTLNITTCLIQ